MILSFVDEIAWVKCNRSKRMAKSHGFYLQHSKETCFVAKIVVLTGLFDVGKSSSTHELGMESDVIYSNDLVKVRSLLIIYEMIGATCP